MNRLPRLIEFIGIFIIVPALYILVGKPVLLLPLLLTMALFCLWRLLSDKSFDRSRLWNPAGLRLCLRQMLIRFAAAALLLSLGVRLLAPDLLFSMVRQHPVVWLLLMIAYPPVSVYPQELIYRTFFFHRYGCLFPNKSAAICVNALVFSGVHIIFRNPVAVILTLAGGILFALTYDKTRSAFAVTCEHALYGCLIFTLGLGRYFYHSSISLSDIGKSIL